MDTSAVLGAVERSERIEKYLGGERWNLAGFLVELAEFDRRRQYQDLGYGTLWSYCEKHLKLPKGQVFRRTTAATLIQQYPQAVDYLRDGRLCMTTLGALKEALTPENAVELFQSAAGKTVEQVEELVASRKPRQIPPESSIRKLPARRAAATASLLVLGNGATAPEIALPTPAPQVAARRSEVKPVCEDLFLVKIPATATWKKKLDRSTEILGHAVPSGKPEDVIEHLFDLLIQRDEKRRKGPTARCKAVPKPNLPRNDVSREPIPIAIQRFVWERDQGRCTFKMPNGERCNSTKLPELHHDPAVADGGKNIPEHLSIHCAEHNRLHAVLRFGARHMDRFRKKPGSAGGTPSPEP